MHYRNLGRTGLTVSALALGTVELGMDYGIEVPGHYGRPDENAAIGLVHAALDAGINFIDTARAYGTSETVLGQALRNRRHRVVLATKATTRLPDGTLPQGNDLYRHLLSQLEISLQQLQTSYVDIWQLHNVDADEVDHWQTIAAVFDEAKRTGMTRWVGGSFYGAEVPLSALAHEWLDTIQVTYSVFDQRLTEKVLPLAQANNVGVTVRSVLLKGALTERAEHLPAHLEPLRAHSRRYRQIVANSQLGLNPAQMALAFALAHPQIDSVLVGVRTAAELEENLRAVENALPTDLIEKLSELRIQDEDLLNPGTWGIPA